jgi:hypothetical protein
VDDLERIEVSAVLDLFAAAPPDVAHAFDLAVLDLGDAAGVLHRRSTEDARVSRLGMKNPLHGLQRRENLLRDATGAEQSSLC